VQRRSRAAGREKLDENRERKNQREPDEGKSVEPSRPSPAFRGGSPAARDRLCTSRHN